MSTGMKNQVISDWTFLYVISSSIFDLKMFILTKYAKSGDKDFGKQ